MKNITNNEKLKYISTLLPPTYITAIKDLIEKGIYNSINEFIREAVREALLQYGYLKIEKHDTDKDTYETRPPKTCDRLNAICENEPYICYSISLIRKHARGHFYNIRKCIQKNKIEYKYGFRIDFINAMARDIAHYITTICNKRIGIKPGTIAKAAQLPPGHAIAHLIAIAMSTLPHETWREKPPIYIFNCHDLKPLACKADLSTIKFAYYAMKGDLNSARIEYTKFRHCL